MTARKINNVLVECVWGDIANQPDIDAVVNAANAELQSGGGVAGAIHRAAGPELERECRPLAPIAPGEAVITGAHRLPNRYVIHCLGPVYGQDQPAEELLADCYRNALQLGEQHQISSIAFPAISTGVFGYPIEAAARVAVKTVVEQIPDLSSVRQIRFVLHDHQAETIHSQILNTVSINPNGLALFTDLYQLTMLQAYWSEGMSADAVFSLFVRRLPARRNFLLACGLDTVLDYLENLRFSSEDIAFLSTLGFSDSFLHWLEDFRFTGDVYAVREGTPIFANEPILEVVAPLPQAQLVETFVMNQIHLQTVLASKAQRVVTAARGRSVADFGSRRIHGTDAALKAARAFYIGGVSATSNVLAGKQFGVPVTGTMAHSYVQAHQDEAAAFEAFARLYPETVLLVDTYDTLAGVGKVIDLAHALGEDFRVKAVRLDSGDLATLSKQARKRLDQAGLDQVKIFASGGLQEDKIAELLAADAPIDSFGVGTSMGVSSDAPDLDIVYKLCEYAGSGRLKLSTGKSVLPGRKQVFRMSESNCDTHDAIARNDEQLPGRPLLEPVMRQGRRLAASYIDLDTIRNYAQTQVARLRERVRAIAPADPPYAVEVTSALLQYQKEVEDRVASTEE